LKICKTISELIEWRNESETRNIGFVPTMGALHQGHLSLVEESKISCKKTVVSIFVNELQFSPEEDFDQYPRTIESDLAALKTLNVDMVFLPNAKEMYNEKFSVVVNELTIAQKLEGASRPGFFSGVTTVVSKLFNLVRPSHAFFGQKDIQQLAIITKMVKNLNYNINVIGCETIREIGGLAMSSRNQYLSNIEKEEASILYQALKLGKKLLLDQVSIHHIKTEMEKLITTNKKIKIDYLSIARLSTFEELEGPVDPTKFKIVISGAVLMKDVRLIDNILI
tara:strand:+ start:405 stop:1247 length:843 start_codon:yes stop_codon:yes gene_type:complete